MKTLVDEIRDMVREASARGMYPLLTDVAKDMLGRSCWSYDDEADLFTKIADRIEREYLPRPRFEDGEPVQFGDEVELHYKSGGCGKGIIQAFHANKGPVWMLSFVGNDHERLFRYDSTCDVLKRPEHEVLDADGVPIKVGDHVWWKDGREFVITAVNRGVNTEAVEPAPGMCSSHVNFDPKEFTHKQPDTLERIEEDASKDFWHYWGCSGARCAECPALIDGKTPEDHYHTDSCGYAKILDLLRRQRHVLEIGQA